MKHEDPFYFKGFIKKSGHLRKVPVCWDSGILKLGYFRHFMDVKTIELKDVAEALLR